MVSEHVVEVTDQTFERVVLEGSKDQPVVVDMWAAWCGPCRTLTPILEKVADERGGAFLLAKLDTDANPNASANFAIRAIPTLIVFRGGREVARETGAVPKSSLEAMLDRAG